MTATQPVRDRPSEPSAAAQPRPGNRRTDVVIIGAGDELLIEIGPVLGDQYRTYSADTVGEIAGLSVTSWIGIYDATTHGAGRSAFTQLESQHGNQPWIVICADADLPNWHDVRVRGGVCAVIARSEISADVLTAALTKATQRLTAVPPEAPIPDGPRGLSPWVWLAAAAVVALAAGANWWLRDPRDSLAVPARNARHSTPTQGGSAPGRSPPASAVEQTPQPATVSVEDLLSMARIAFRDPATQLPRTDAPLEGASALELYGAVLQQQPRNDEALNGVRRLESVARLRVQNALAAGDAETAARLVAILEHGNFQSEELRALEAAVAAARLKQLAAQARSAINAGNLPAARQLIDQLLTLNGERSPVPELRKELEARRLDLELLTDAEQVRAAIAAGALLEPETDNARARFLAMRDLNRTSPQTAAVQHELLLALLHRAQAAINRQELDGAQQILAAAQDFGSKAELTDARSALDAAIAAKRIAEAPSAPAPQAARSSAPAAEARTAAVPIILSPKSTRSLEVKFPPAALAANIQGYAIVEFTLNPDGSAVAAAVIESSPRGTFDTAALAAIKHATFSTRELADPKQPQRARLKISFRLHDAAGPTPAVSKASPGPVSAAPRDAAADPLQTLSPKPTQPLQVNYPQVALELHRTGYAIVEFMLNPDGTPGSPTVIESVPEKVFDYEALMAVKRARFFTTDLADPNRAQRARVKISFKGP